MNHAMAKCTTALVLAAAPAAFGQLSANRTYRTTTVVRGAAQDWLTVGIDQDGDGRFERFEVIHRRDLDDALARTNTRSDREAQLSGLRGEIRQVQTAYVTRTNTPHLIVDVVTPYGEVETADLGPRHRLERLDLRPGSDVTIFGTRALVEDRPMILARSIAVDGQAFTVDLDPPTEFYRGEILSLRDASFAGFDEERLLATVALEDGRVVTVDLGPEEFLDRLDLDDGDFITFRANKGRIDNRTALFAYEVRAGNREIRIEHVPNRDVTTVGTRRWSIQVR